MNETSISHLLAAFAEELGIWLNALPLSSLGLRMDDSTFQIAISLRLGLAFCKPHYIVAITVVVRSPPLPPMALVVSKAMLIITVIVL